MSSKELKSFPFFILPLPGSKKEENSWSDEERGGAMKNDKNGIKTRT
jgi:hypothetical protein